MQVPFLRRQTLSTQQRRSLHSCSPGFQDCKNPEMFRQVFFSMFLGSSASLQEPWNVSSSFLLGSRFICFIIVMCLESNLTWKHTWIWVTPCKKSSNSIIIESMSLIWDYICWAYKCLFVSRKDSGSYADWAKLCLSRFMPLSHVYNVHIQFNIPGSLHCSKSSNQNFVVYKTMLSITEKCTSVKYWRGLLNKLLCHFFLSELNVVFFFFVCETSPCCYLQIGPRSLKTDIKAPI